MVLKRSSTHVSVVITIVKVQHTIIATPTNVDHPSRSYSDTNAKNIWNEPEMRMRP